MRTAERDWNASWFTRKWAAIRSAQRRIGIRMQNERERVGRQRPAVKRKRANQQRAPYQRQKLFRQLRPS